MYNPVVCEKCMYGLKLLLSSESVVKECLSRVRAKCKAKGDILIIATKPPGSLMNGSVMITLPIQEHNSEA